MASSYYKHTLTHSRKVSYSFQCEQCMQDSGPLTAKLEAEAECSTIMKTMNEKQDAQLKIDAHDNLVNRVHNSYIDATEKQIFSTAFKDACPHCKKPQSWAVSGLKDGLISIPIVTIVLGALIALAIYFFQGDRNLMMSLVIGGGFVAAAVIYFIYKLIRIGIKTGQTASATQKNVPVIDWSAAEDLLNEYREKQALKNSKKKKAANI